MCQQVKYQHACSHITPGHPIACGLPSALGLQHTILRPIVLNASPCPFCVPYQGISPQLLSTRYSIYPWLQPFTLPSSTPSFPQALALSIYTPLPQPNLPVYQALPQVPPALPLPVPANTQQDIRYEFIGGLLQPVTHYYSSSTPASVSQQRGFNVFHGYDCGSLPPGWGPSAPQPSLSIPANWIQIQTAAPTEPNGDAGQRGVPDGPVNAEGARLLVQGSAASGASCAALGGGVTTPSTGDANASLAISASTLGSRGLMNGELPLAQPEREAKTEGEQGDVNVQAANEDRVTENTSSVAAVAGSKSDAEKSILQSADGAGQVVAGNAVGDAAAGLERSGSRRRRPINGETRHVRFDINE